MESFVDQASSSLLAPVDYRKQRERSHIYETNPKRVTGTSDASWDWSENVGLINAFLTRPMAGKLTKNNLKGFSIFHSVAGSVVQPGRTHR